MAARILSISAASMIRQPSGLREQLELIVLNYPRWLETTAGSSRHSQLWLQHRRGGLKVGRT